MNTIAIVGAAETTELGEIPHTSQLELHCDAALNALADAGLKPGDIDGVATAGENPVSIAHHLGIVPKYVDGTGVGGCSFMLHVRHAAAAINEGLCSTVLITHGESGKSNVGRTLPRPSPASLQGQFEVPYGVFGPPTLFTLPVLRYMKTFSISEEQLAMVAVVQREWAAMNPRASYRDPISVQHQWRRPLVHAFGHVRHVRVAGERSTVAWHRGRAGAWCEYFHGARRWRNVRCQRHRHSRQPSALMHHDFRHAVLNKPPARRCVLR